MQVETQISGKLSFEEFRKSILADYALAKTSREVSILARREVLGGNAKFGVFGDGKEIPQLALAKCFKNGDFRSGYYRDQTLMFATKGLSLEGFFSQLYAHTDVDFDQSSGGRQMNAHFGTRLLNKDGSWKTHTAQKNSSADISPTAAQMPRLLGLAHASKIYRSVEALQHLTDFSIDGNEVAWGTIGDASTAQGVFFETINAACVLQVPMVLSIWDDGYGISVPTEHQRSKKYFNELLKGFQRTETAKGIEIIQVKGWSYPALIDAYQRAEKIAREEHIPVVVHVTELTQPSGHSTSGSHERYKDTERLSWEKEYDCLKKFREWIVDFELTDHDQGILAIAKDDELNAIDIKAKKDVKDAQIKAWNAYRKPIIQLRDDSIELLSLLTQKNPNKSFIQIQIDGLVTNKELHKKDIFNAIRQTIRICRNEDSIEKNNLIDYYQKILNVETKNYSSHLYSETEYNATKIATILPEYPEDKALVDGRIILKNNFDAIFNNRKDVFVFGEDTGNIGDVNQGLEGLQKKHGKIQIADTGIREATIIGQAIGMALRGLRPIAEIQYLDYVLYGISAISDDIATTLYRTKGGQKAPVIIRTRGHRLEGIWHSGSPMGGILNLIRGVLVLVPRNMQKAAGFYNTLLQSDEPALVVECLNQYRVKEFEPMNYGEFTTPVGVVDITRTGSDITLITYGSTWKIVTDAAKELAQLGIDTEVIDVQSLIPFDITHDIKKSLTKTSRLVVIDEDVPGGCSAYILQKILEEQGAYYLLDSKPTTITAKEHRAAYGSDGDYFSKPSVDDVVEKIYQIMHEAKPSQYPSLGV